MRRRLRLTSAVKMRPQSLFSRCRITSPLVFPLRGIVSLIEAMQRAAGSSEPTSYRGDEVLSDEERQAIEVDDQGHMFRKPFLIPNRQTYQWNVIQRLIGNRIDPKNISSYSFFDRLQMRRPRKEDMSPDQDWPNVWPAAQSFRSSVVPLPIHMGALDKLPPFPAKGNLELVKIPNFLHLTPLHIQRHCEAIRKFCTKWPENLTDEVMEEQFPLTISYSDYVHQGTSLRDMRARIITMKLKLSALKLDDLSKDKLIRLAGWRYSKQDGTLTIVTDRCYTRKQNLDYANYLLTALYHESQKREEWEVLKERVDNRYVEFTGSQCEEKLLDIMQKIAKAEVKDGSTLPIPPAVADLKDPESAPVDKELDKETLLKHPTVEQFAATWSELRNQEETPALTRQYSDRVRQLLGIPALPDSKFEALHRRSPAMQSSKIPDELYEPEAKKKFRRNY